MTSKMKMHRIKQDMIRYSSDLIVRLVPVSIRLRSVFFRSHHPVKSGNLPVQSRVLSRRFIISLIILVVTLPIFYLVNHYKSSAQATQWWPSGKQYAQRKQLTVTNNSAATLSSGTTIAVTLDTNALFQQGKVQNDCDDLRIIYQPNDSTTTELTRHLVYPSGKTCATSTATKVFFKTQASLSAAASSTDYYAYYKNSEASTPSSTDAAFNVGAATATLVCPFDGSTTCAAGETPSTATGAIRYSGAKSAMSFDGFNDFIGFSTTTFITGKTAFTVEAWVKANTTSTTKMIFNEGRPQDGTWVGFYIGADNRVNLSIYTSSPIVATSTNALTAGWHHVAATFSTTNGMKIWIDGVQDGSNANTTNTARAVQPIIGAGWNADSSKTTVFSGLMDEFRISLVERYTASFTSSTAPFQRDSNTSMLLHFDENGDDPRNTGKAIDDSGNANHGTITGAKYVAGLVGVDGDSTAPSSWSGAIGSQSYAGHGGIFIEEGTTNKITNPSFENATAYDTNWTTGGNITATANTTAPYYKFGSKSAKLVASADDTFTISINAGNTNTHTLSAYVYDGTTGNVGGTVSATVAKLVFNGAAVTPASYTDMGGGWWRLSYSAAGIASSQSFGVQVLSGKTVYVDGIQLEEKAYATTYADGTMGTGYAWTGTANNSTSSRTIANMQYTNSGDVGAGAGAISFWAYLLRTTDTYDYVFSAGNPKQDNSARFYQGSSGQWNFKVGNGNSLKITTVSPDKWYHFVGTWDSSNNVIIYINGSAGFTGTRTNSGATTATPISFGQSIDYVGGYDGMPGKFSDLRIFSTALTSTQVTDLYQAGLVAHSEGYQVDAFTGNKGQDPVAIWHMDEGYGTTVRDSIASLQNDMTMGTGSSAPSWSTSSSWSGGADGAIGSRALKFDGSNDYVTRADDSDFDFSATDSFTISGWFRHSSTISGTDTILAKSNSTAGYKVYMNSSGYICFGIDDDTTWGPDDSACTTTSYADSKWHHFEAVKTLTTSITLYMDGILKATDSSISATGTLANSVAIYIGIDGDGASNPFDGYLDEIYIYPYARTAAQIKTDYNARAAALSWSSDASVGAIGSLSQGLVGYWKMDESSANGCTGGVNDSCDSSGNANDGAWNGDATSTAGKFGNGVTFDGTGDYVSINGIAQNSYTRTAWIKVGSGSSSRRPVLGGPNGTLVVEVFEDNKIKYYDYGLSSPGYHTIDKVLITDTWYFFGITYNGSQIKMFLDGELKYSANAAGTPQTLSRIGSYNIWEFNGSLDEVRIYNRALSASEIRQLYNFAPGPKVHLKMDEGTGTSAQDSSGNSNTGTLNDSPTWSTGKYGKGIKLDGSNDDVSIPDFGY